MSSKHSLSDPQSTCMSVNQEITDIVALNKELFESETGNTCPIGDLASEAISLEPIVPNDLLDDQHQAYDVVNWHLQQFISGMHPKPLQMIIPGEAGVGKSKTIQTITENFISHGVKNILVKAAYTGLAASIINGQTLHCIAMMPLKGGKQSVQTIKVLKVFWRDKHYLIIDKMSMISHQMFSKLSSIIS